MADIALAPSASVDPRTTMYAQQNTGLILAEDVDAGMAVRIGTGFRLFKAKASDGRFDGIVPLKGRVGQPMTIFGSGARFRLTEGALDPTKHYYLSETPGLFADTGTGDPVVRCVSLHDAEVVRVGKVG